MKFKFGGIQSSAAGLVDQGITGGRQFLVLLVAAAVMSRDEFADFARLTAGALLVLQVANYCLRLPMLLLAGGKFLDRREEYLRLLRWVDIGFAASGALAVGAFIAPSLARGGAAAIGLFVAMCVSNGLLEFNRRTCYIRRKIEVACAASLVSLASAVAALGAANHFGAIGLNSVLAIQCLSMGAGAALCWRGGLWPDGRSAVSLRDIVIAHHAYAGWEVLGGALLWSCTNGLIVFGSGLLSSGQIGAFRLLASLSQVVALPLTVAEMSLSTSAAKVYALEGRPGLAQWLRSMNDRFRFLLVPYITAAALFTWVFMRVVLRRKYPEAESLFPIFLTFATLTIVPTTRNIALRAMGLSRRVCQSEMARAATCAGIYIVAYRMRSPLLLTSALAFGTLSFTIAQYWQTSTEILRSAPECAFSGGD